MKIKIIVFLIGLLLFMVSCSNKKSAKQKVEGCCSYEILRTGNSMFDTINLIDEKGLRQGIWITKKVNGLKDSTVYRNDSSFYFSGMTISETARLLKKVRISDKP
jgi:hypothetical protein